MFNFPLRLHKVWKPIMSNIWVVLLIIILSPLEPGWENAQQKLSLGRGVVKMSITPAVCQPKMSEHRNEKNLWTRQEDAGRQQSHAGGEFYSDQSMNHGSRCRAAVISRQRLDALKRKKVNKSGLRSIRRDCVWGEDPLHGFFLLPSLHLDLLWSILVLRLG